MLYALIATVCYTGDTVRRSYSILYHKKLQVWAHRTDSKSCVPDWGHPLTWDLSTILHRRKICPLSCVLTKTMSLWARLLISEMNMRRWDLPDIKVALSWFHIFSGLVGQSVWNNNALRTTSVCISYKVFIVTGFFSILHLTLFVFLHICYGINNFFEVLCIGFIGRPPF